MFSHATGESLIFLACQPRSGSTLLQKMLGTHPEIETTQETWVMLPPSYTLRENGVRAEYSTFWARQAIEHFLDELPSGEEAYFEGVRRMHLYLYHQYLESKDGSLFLDKTPRYYLILPELYRTFPDAHFILLVRNPLAVLSSILRSWVGTDWFHLYDYRVDLRRGPKSLIAGRTLLDDQSTFVRYEDLVKDPSREMKRLCGKLGVDFSPDLIEYDSGDTNWQYGDQETVTRKNRPEIQSLEKWAETSQEDPQHWRLLYDYLNYISPKVLDKMGYSHDRLLSSLEAMRPSSTRLSLTMPLDWLLAKPREERTWYETTTVRGRNVLHRNRLGRALIRAVE